MTHMIHTMDRHQFRAQHLTKLLITGLNYMNVIRVLRPGLTGRSLLQFTELKKKNFF